MASNNNSQKFNSKFGGVSAKKSSSVDTDQMVKLKENNHIVTYYDLVEPLSSTISKEDS